MEFNADKATQLAKDLIFNDIVQPELEQSDSAFDPAYYHRITESLKQAILDCYGPGLDLDPDLEIYQVDAEGCKVGEYCYIMSFQAGEPVTEEHIRKMPTNSPAEQSIQFFTESGIRDQIDSELEESDEVYRFDTLFNYGILACLKTLNGDKNVITR